MTATDDTFGCYTPTPDNVYQTSGKLYMNKYIPYTNHITIFLRFLYFLKCSIAHPLGWYVR
jgi:hypothetical protein